MASVYTLECYLAMCDLLLDVGHVILSMAYSLTN